MQSLSVLMYVIVNLFCLSVYAVELFNYSHTYISDLYVAWRKVIGCTFHIVLVIILLLSWEEGESWPQNDQIFI